MSEILDAALGYRRRGWSLIPLGADKKPSRKWKRFQTAPASEATLSKWFGGRGNAGVAVIFGSISGGLGSRDFDDMEAYRSWSAERPELAATLPTVETSRGRHVYFIVPGECERRFRTAIGKPSGIGAINCIGGELRLGVGSYSVLPPSLHPSGHVYQWLTQPDSIPRVDLFNSGFGPSNREVRREPKTLGAEDEWGPLTPFSDGSEVESNIDPLAPASSECLEYSLGTLSSLLHERIEAAIQRTLPTGSGKRHRKLFDFARELKSIPEFEGYAARAHRAAVREWHRRARPYITTQEFDETWLDFLEGFGKVKTKLGEGPMAQLFKHAATMPVPPEAEGFESPQLRLLASLCRELQRVAGPSSPFYIASRSAGELFGVSHVHASRWLRLLRREGLIREVSKGKVNSEASRYRYLGKL